MCPYTLLQGAAHFDQNGVSTWILGINLYSVVTLGHQEQRELYQISFEYVCFCSLGPMKEHNFSYSYPTFGSFEVS